MKNNIFIFLAILFFLCSLGVNLYLYYDELLKNANEIEEFSISQPGIMINDNNEFLVCDVNDIGKYTSYTYTPSTGFGALTTIQGKCTDISYVDQDGNIKTNLKAYIFPNYYVDPVSGILQPVPYGYKANSKQTGYYATSISALIETSNNSFAPPPIMDNNNEYKSLQSIQYNKGYNPSDDTNGAPPGKMYFPNGDGTAVLVDINTYDQSNQYHETATYDAGLRNFVPNYEDTTLLSKLGSQNIQDYKNKDPIYLAGAPLANTKSSYTNIDTLYKSDPDALEKACNAMDHKICASSSSCALLGGQKCVSANANGPIKKSNYSDYLIINRDYYYYRGQCYGMCSPNHMKSV
jgi:hypothetical protein